MKLAGLILVVIAFYLSSKDTNSPDKGYDWLRKLDANVHEYTADGTLLMQKLRGDIDRKQLPDWMNVPFVRMPLDWDLLRKQGNEWLRYWDTEIRGRGK